MINLTDQPWLSAPETQAVVRALTRDGTAVRFVGGCVRDGLLGRAVKDIDIATPDPPEIVVTLLEAANIKAVPTGIDHGTVTAVCNHRPFEVTTLRVDVETDGRRATVAFTDDWTADAARRDLTVNALSCDPDGKLFDPFGGADDLRTGRIRFVGSAEARIREDNLRLLRFFRFFAHYGEPPVDREALAACRLLADLLPTLSGERMQTELFKLLTAERAADVLALMSDEDILAHFLPEASRFERLRRLIAIEIELGIDPTPPRRLAAVLMADADIAADIADRLRLSGADRAYLTDMTTAIDGFAPIGDPAVRRRWFYCHGAGRYRELLLLGAARNGVTADDLRRELDAVEAWVPPVFPLGGGDVIARGVASGPRIGVLLRQVEDWWLASDFAADRDACLTKLDQTIEESVDGGGSAA